MVVRPFGKHDNPLPGVFSPPERHESKHLPAGIKKETKKDEKMGEKIAQGYQHTGSRPATFAVVAKGVAKVGS